MHAWPIWNSVTACTYKSDKSWGARRNCAVRVNIGASAQSSNGFVSHETTRNVYTDEEGRRVAAFRFYVCGVLLKETIIQCDSADRANGPILSERCAYIGAVRHKEFKTR